MSENNDTTGRKVWSGTLTFGLVSTPVALFPAAREEHVSFNMLHSECHSRIKQELKCPVCDKGISRSETVKGYELKKSEYVIVSEDDLKEIAPRSSHTMEIMEFVPAGDVDAIYFESSFFLGVTEGGEKPYSLIREAMILKDVVGIAQLFYSGKEHVAVIRPVPGGLMLHTLYWNNEVRSFAFTRLPEVNDRELTIACQLVDALAAKFEPSKFTDEYRGKVLELIQRKASGETISQEQPAKKPPENVVDMADALLASLAQASGSRRVSGGVQ